MNRESVTDNEMALKVTPEIETVANMATNLYCVGIGGTTHESVRLAYEILNHTFAQSEAALRIRVEAEERRRRGY